MVTAHRRGQASPASALTANGRTATAVHNAPGIYLVETSWLVELIETPSGVRIEDVDTRHDSTLGACGARSLGCVSYQRYQPAFGMPVRGWFASWGEEEKFTTKREAVKSLRIRLAGVMAKRAASAEL